jgi:hypothetical protein
LDILYLVDGSGSIRRTNFESIKHELKVLSGKFDIGPDKTQIALMQFGRATATKIEFNLGEKSTLQAVNDGVDNMSWLTSLGTATGDAIKKAGEQARFFKSFSSSLMSCSLLWFVLWSTEHFRGSDIIPGCRERINFIVHFITKSASRPFFLCIIPCSQVIGSPGKIVYLH